MRVTATVLLIPVLVALFVLRLEGAGKSQSLDAAIPFWALMVIGFCLWTIRLSSRYRPMSGLMALTAIMNGAVVLANGGFMPVVGMEVADGHWIPATEGHRLLWLADRTAFAGFSPGDFVLGLAVLAGLVAWISSLRRLPMTGKTT